MINEKNAHKYCSEPIENIEGYADAIADETRMWDIHHRGEVLPCGIYSAKTLKKFGLYYNRPAAELIFVARSQHWKIHRDLRAKGGKIGGKIGAKIMNAKLTFEDHSKAGKIGGKIGAKNQPREAKVRGGKIGGKIAGKKMLGKKAWNNGVISTWASECPGPGWVRGRLKRT